MSIDINTLLAAIDAIDDSLVLEFSDTESLKKEFGQKNKKRKVNFKKLLLAAVISALLIVAGLFAVSSSDNDSILDLKNGIYRIFGNNVAIIFGDLDNEPDEIKAKEGEIIDILEKEGFTDIVLPAALLNGEWGDLTFNSTSSEDSEMHSTIISFDGGYMSVSYLDFSPERLENSFFSVENIKSVFVNGVEVVVAEREDGSVIISYLTEKNTDESTESNAYYKIIFNSGITFEEALEMAETIG